ncbi:MAG: SdpI family protein [Isosphaeraceae bacterium]
MTTLLVMYLATSALLILLSVPLLLGRVPPNPLYGFRLSPTLDDPALWYPVNRHSARRMIAAGLSLAAAAVGLTFVPSITVDVYALGCLAVFLVVLVVGLVQSILYMNALQRSRDAG